MRHLQYQWLIVLGLLGGSGCSLAPTEGGTADNLWRARRLAAQTGREVRDRGAGTAAEFASRQRGGLDFQAALVLGSPERMREAAVTQLATLDREIDQGEAWRIPVVKMEVPELLHAPRIDGDITGEEWSAAYCFTGEYMLNETAKIREDASRFQIGWHGETLYVAAVFRDKEIVSYPGKLDRRDKMIFMGDCLEFFVRPQKSQLLYYEFLVNPEGKLWGLAHINQLWGKWSTIEEDRKTASRCKTQVAGDVWRIELAVPMRELHGQWCARPPKAGDEFSWMLVRTNRNKDGYTKSTVVPLLYDGHNIYQYVDARLGKKPISRSGK